MGWRDDTPQRVVKKDHREKVVVTSRADWKARAPTEELPALPSPLHEVIFTWTDTEPCLFPDECQKLVRDVQLDHMKKGLPDIQYHFLVGSDKIIYEGRGWDKAGPSYPDTIKNADEFNGKCIEIAFIEKNMEEPTAEFIDTVSRFLALAMMNNKVDKPVNIRGIKDNEIVSFYTLFEKDRYI